MPTFDAHANLALATVAVAPSPALSGTSLIIASGFASLFPATPFNATIFPATAAPTAANAEIVRVTNITGDIFTITRAQEGTTAKAIAAGYKIGNTVTAKCFTDIETAVNAITGGGTGGVAISAGANSQATGTIAFSNSNGVTFGLSNNGMLTASVGAGGVPGSISAGTTNVALGEAVFSNSNGITFGLNGSTLTGSHNGLTSQSNQAFSAQGGSSAFQTLIFSNSNGISFSNSGGSVVASHNGLTSQSNQAASASNGSFAFQTLGFSNANNVTFGTSAGSIITASVAPPGAGSVNFSGGTTSNNLATIVFSNSNGVSFGLDGSTMTASVAPSGGGATLSHYSNALLYSYGTRAFAQASIVMAEIIVPQAVSFDYLRIPVAMGVAGTTLATFASATASASAAISHSFYGMFFTRGTGASIDELNTVLSTSAVSVFSQAINMSNTSEGSYSQGVTGFNQAAQTTLSTQYSISNTNYSFSSNEIATNFSGTRFLDIPFGGSLSAGNYWFGFVRNSSSDSAGAAGFSNMSRASLACGSYNFVSQPDVRFLNMGMTQSTRALLGGGNATINSLTPTASVDASNISSLASNQMIYFQLHRT